MYTVKSLLYPLAILNVVATVWNLVTQVDWKSHSKHIRSMSSVSCSPPLTDAIEYSYIGDDYPLEYPMTLDNVALTLQETTRYGLNLSDPVSEEEWTQLVLYPKGLGRTRLGPEHRLFIVTYYHQLHCLRKMEVGLLQHENKSANEHHFQHCINYLRQTILCDATDAVEEGDFMTMKHGPGVVGDTLVCKDWQKAYDVLDENFEEFVQWRKEWN
jgi:hypothetical protein